MPLFVHLGAGVGNVVLATPLLIALEELGFVVDVLLAADYPETSELLRPWTAVRDIFIQPGHARLTRAYEYVIPALPPFYATRYGRASVGLGQTLPRPPDALFYQNEQEFYLSFARKLGYPAERHPWLSLPIAPSPSREVTAETLVLAPGCKTGEMAAKRWPYFPELAEAFGDVTMVGTTDDLHRRDGAPFAFPSHVRSFVNQLTLRQTAEVMAGAAVVVANDSGLAYVAAAVGVPTIIMFGPTPDQTLGQFPPSVTALRQGLACEPCWFRSRFEACDRRMTCLEELRVEVVIEEIERKGIKRSLPRRLV